MPYGDEAQKRRELMKSKHDRNKAFFFVAAIIVVIGAVGVKVFT